MEEIKNAVEVSATETAENQTEVENQTEAVENGETKQSFYEQVKEDGKITPLEYVLIARYFLPILATVGWIVLFIFGNSDVGVVISNILMTIGVISAFTVSPLKLLKVIIKSAVKGFQIVRAFIPYYGLSDIIGGLFGFTGGLFVGVMIVFMLPAVFTIKKFFDEDSFE